MVAEGENNINFREFKQKKNSIYMKLKRELLTSTSLAQLKNNVNLILLTNLCTLNWFCVIYN